MTVEERRGSNARGGGSSDQFPVGMRVLAVDDDPTCLKLLETLLRRCQYHVTTTNQAIVALKLLRENKDKFDLVISDVHMPDMDGFKLLELVGLEMDLPVIMLSANSDPKAVMKGITHGACDYLLKPVRLEELKNIWQHVVRRKKFDSRDHNNYDHVDEGDKASHVNSEGGHGRVTGSQSDSNGRLNRKRKENEDDDDDSEDNGHENEDPSSLKKPRVVWSVDLHRKFVAAVNQLGIDKAMPKRILDLMNVEKLTRENVASHLQKYRLYLKRISNVASQQATIVAALGGKDSPYLQMGSLDGVRNYHAFAGSGQLSTLANFQQGGMLGRLNSPAGSGLYGLPSSGMIQLGHTQNNTTNPIHDIGKLPNISFSGTTQTNLLQGMSTSLEINQLQQQKTVFESVNPLTSSSDARFPVGNSNNSFLNTANNTHMLQAQQQQKQSNGFSNQSSTRLTSLSTDPFEMTCGVSSFLPDLGRGNDTWTGAAPLTGYATNSLPLAVPFSHESLPSNNLRESISPISSSIEGNLHNACSNNAVVLPLTDPMMGRDFQCQANSLGGNMMIMPMSTNEIPGFSEIESIGSSQQRWEGHRQDQTHKPNLLYNSSSNSMLPNQGLVDSMALNPGFNNGISNKKVDISGINQSNFNAPICTQNCDVGRSISNGQQKFKEEYLLDSTKLQGGFNSNGFNTFDDLMNAMVKREDTLMDGDIGCDMYSLETCM